MLKLVLHTVTTVLRELNKRHSRRRTEKRWGISRYMQLRYQVETNNGSLQLGFIIQEWKILQYFFICSSWVEKQEKNSLLIPGIKPGP